MKTKILLAGLVVLSVAAVAQQSSQQKPSPKTGQVMVRESPSKASLGRRESPSKPSTMVRESPSKRSVTAADLDGDGRADRGIGSQSSGAGAGVAINNSPEVGPASAPPAKSGGSTHTPGQSAWLGGVLDCPSSSAGSPASSSG